MPDKQAEAEAEAISEALAVNFKDLATKEDLLQLRTELKNEVRETEQRLNAKIDTSFGKLQGEMTLIKYMLTVCVTFLIGLGGLMIRMLFVQSR